MHLAPTAVAAILGVEGHGIVPHTSRARKLAQIDALKRAISVSDDDPPSIAFRNRLGTVADLLDDDAQKSLEDTPILFLDSPLPEARVVHVRDRDALLMCRGLFDLVHFRMTLTHAMSLMQKVEAARPDGELTASEYTSLAGHIILADSYANLRPAATMVDMLGPTARRDVEIGVSSALLLLMMHEMGHVALGHTQVHDGAQVVSDADASREDMEFAADAFAMDAIGESAADHALPGLLILFETVRLLETFGLRPGSGYPTIARRIDAMIARLPLTHSATATARDWTEGYNRRSTSIGADAASPEDILKRFERTMPITEAYRTIDRMRQDLAARGLVLDREGDLGSPLAT